MVYSEWRSLGSCSIKCVKCDWCFIFCEFAMEKLYKISFDPVVAKCCWVVMAARWVGGRYEGHSDGML